jgi:hypothetical protein
MSFGLSDVSLSLTQNISRNIEGLGNINEYYCEIVAADTSRTFSTLYRILVYFCQQQNQSKWVNEMSGAKKNIFDQILDIIIHILLLSLYAILLYYISKIINEFKGAIQDVLYFFPRLFLKIYHFFKRKLSGENTYVGNYSDVSNNDYEEDDYEEDDYDDDDYDDDDYDDDDYEDDTEIDEETISSKPQQKPKNIDKEEKIRLSIELNKRKDGFIYKSGSGPHVVDRYTKQGKYVKHVSKREINKLRK